MRAKSRGCHLSLSTKIGPSTARSSSSIPSGACAPIEGALLLGVELAQRAFAEQHLADRVGVGVALQPSRAHEATGDRVDLDAEPAEPPDVFADLLGVERAQLDHRIADAPLDPARAHDDARPVERQLGRVEEHHLADLGIQRVEPERADRRALLGGGDGELELDRVRAAQEAHHLRELRIGQAGRTGVLVAMPSSSARGGPHHHPVWMKSASAAAAEITQLGWCSIGRGRTPWSDESASSKGRPMSDRPMFLYAAVYDEIADAEAD